MISEQRDGPSNSFLKYTIDIFPNTNFYRILENVCLTCQIVFENKKSSEVLTIPQSAKDFVSIDFHGPDYGEPAR